LLKLLNDVITICRDPRIERRYSPDPRHIYRSILPFLPLSSPIRTHYNKLSDPVRLLRVDGRIDKLHAPPLQSNNALTRDDELIIPITCAALSDDGHQVALGFCDGVVEVVDAELGVRVSRFVDGPPNPLLWLLFTGRGDKLVTENSKGEVCILDNITLRRLQFASRLDGAEKAMASLSHDGSMIVRVAQSSGREWCGNATIIRISTEGLIINALAPPSLDYPLDANNDKSTFPLLRSLGFSPDGQYVAAFDMRQAFIWSSTSFQVVARYSFEDPAIWFLNTSHQPAMPPLEFPKGTNITLVCEPPGSIHSSSCVLFALTQQPPPHVLSRMKTVSWAAGTVPLLSLSGNIWFGGRMILGIPAGYRYPKSCSIMLPTPQITMPSDELLLADVALPTSRDGTRFLICDAEGLPVIVDISEVIDDIAA
jgi:hypothetical protein